MPKITLPVGIGFYQSASIPLAAQQCVNYYPQNPQTIGSLSRDAVFFTPGIEQVATAGRGPARGFNLFGGNIYYVSGTEFFRIEQDFSVTNLGLISGSPKRCSLTNNGETIAIQVPGGDGYFYDEVNGLQLITDPDYQTFQAQEGGVQGVAFKNGYFVYTTQFEFFLSSLVTENGGRNFSGINFGTAEIKPDPNVRPANIKNQLHIIGTDTIEKFQDTGTGLQPFQRIENATLDKGLLAQFAFTEHDNSYAFLGGGTGEGASIWRGGPGAAQKISTSAIDVLINEYTLEQLSDVNAISYSEDGSFFLGFKLPNEDIVYDSTASAIQGRPVWHLRQTNGSGWRVADVADVFGKNIVMDTIDGRIGVMSRQFNTEYGETVKRRATGAFVSEKGTPMFISDVELKCENGTGGEISLDLSTDGGRTFKSLGSKSLGEVGDYTARQKWSRLGDVPYDVVFGFETEGAFNSNVLEMVVNLEGGRQ